QLASAVAVTGNAQIQGIADVCTELNGVVADDAGPVVDELILVFALQKRAVATIDAQAKTDAAKGAGTNNIASVFITRVAEAADSAAGRLIVVGEAVTAKDMHFLGGLQVAANVEGIIVKDAGAISCEVGDNARTRRSGHSAKDSNGLRRNHCRRNDVASELGA